MIPQIVLAFSIVWQLILYVLLTCALIKYLQS